ncbi:MAG TPA: diacylglycerol kinase family protein [Cytophagales bacterium]|nr:diacylglycerol kinase family protein [Cytophagales bacterium]
MMDEERFSFKKRLKSFSYALSGIQILLTKEHNARIHGVAAVAAIILGVYLHLSPIEWCLIAIAIGLVFAFELVNTALEQLADFVCIDRHASIKRVKDLAAGAVLVSAIVSLCIAGFVFLPKFV